MTVDNTITHILNNTRDPVLGLSAQEMGIKTLITIEQLNITLNLSAGFPCDFLQDTLLPRLSASLTNKLPNYTFTITLDPFIKAHQTQLVGKSIRGVRNTIAIASGKGGVGKSTVTVNMAVALARAGARVGILDADIYGPSIPLMLGATEPVELSGERYLPIRAHGVQAMSIGYLTDRNEPLIWRGPMLAKSFIQMLDITQWDDLDYLLIDLPPGTGDIQLSLVQKIPLTAAIIVTTPQNVATLDAQKALNMFEKTGIHVLGIIENMALHTCSQCGHADPIFGHGGAQQLSSIHHCKLLGQLPLDARIATHCDEGKPSAASGTNDIAIAFMSTALQAAIALSHRPLNYADKFPPIVAV
jgi:ATP-binding protein involved in chromosome partitioning